VKTEVVAAIGNRQQRSRTAAIDGAVKLLEAGEVVALPTETVYGLAADALRPDAALKIFEAKERPRFDPLIVHLPDISWLQKVAKINTEDEELVSRLENAFWPGPLTIILPKTSVVPDIVTAGLDSVAVRISADPIFREIIGAFGSPLAAPSANRFGRISPTTAQHVLNELEGRIPLVVDGGPTTHGVESTIIAIQNRKIEILRPGPITEEDLRAVGCEPIKCPSGLKHRPAADATILRAPGQLPSHYAPKTPLRLVDNLAAFSLPANQRLGLLGWSLSEKNKHFAVVRNLSEKQDLREAAANLFGCLRELDEAKLDLILVELVPENGLGVAINDRLRRAAGL
jgi:L-threonylcarbamoyladenylate synthase